MNALCVAPEQVDLFWPHTKEFIEAAFLRNRGDDDADIVYDDLRNGRSLLWIAWADDDVRILMATTTKIIATRRGKVCLITSCGGRALHRWQHCLADIEKYAKAEGCALVRFEGRKGWQAIFPEYRQPWIVLEKKL